MDEPQTYWLSLGTNLGDRTAALVDALGVLAEHVEVTACSAIYETSARELLDQPAFLNLTTRIQTPWLPQRVLELCGEVERRGGRTRTVRFGPRQIDCDILLWSGGTWDTPDLTVPHARIAERRFALVPTCEIDPDATLPDGTPLAALAAALDADEQLVTRVAEPPRVDG